jgi:hypothetical protein
VTLAAQQQRSERIKFRSQERPILSRQTLGVEMQFNEHPVTRDFVRAKQLYTSVRIHRSSGVPVRK